MKLSIEKEKANLAEEKSYNLRLLERTETTERELSQLRQRHGVCNINISFLFLSCQIDGKCRTFFILAKEVHEFALYEGAKYQRLAEFVNTQILTQSTTIGRVVWEYDEYLGKIRTNPAFISNVSSSKTFQIKGPNEPDYKCLIGEYQSQLEHELHKVKFHIDLE